MALLEWLQPAAAAVAPPSEPLSTAAGQLAEAVAAAWVAGQEQLQQGMVVAGAREGAVLGPPRVLEAWPVRTCRPP